MSNSKSVYLLGVSSVEFENLDSKYAPSEIAKVAVQNCFTSLGINQNQVDFLISACSTPDFNNPSLSQSLIGRFDSWNIGGIEIRQSAAGLNYALELGRNFIQAGIHDSIIIVCTDLMARMYHAAVDSGQADPKLEAIKSLSADGVFAALLCSEPFLQNITQKPKFCFKVLDSLIASNSKGAESFEIQNPSSSQCPERLTLKNYLANQHVAKLDKNSFLENAQECFFPSISPMLLEVGALIVHSPIANILQLMQLAAPKFKVIDNVEQIGYMGSAGLGVTLLRYLNSHQAQTGDKIAIAAVGAGLNWGLQTLEVC